MLYKSFEFGLEKRNHILPLAAIGLGISAASAIGSLAQGVYNSYQNKKTNDRNYNLAQQQMSQNMLAAQTNLENNQLNRDALEWNKQMSNRDFDYNRQLQERIFQREDSAVQRMVADNRLAGLSPIAGLAGAGVGQALESNTSELGQLGQVSQNMTAPQLSANQLTMDFAQLNSVGQQLREYQNSKDALKLEQERLGLEKSSNEANLKDLAAKTAATELSNNFAKATLEDRIEGARLGNRKVEKEIGKAAEEIIKTQLGNSFQRIANARSVKELQEWTDNAQLREDLGKLSLDQAKQKLALDQLLYKQKDDSWLPQMQVLEEQLTKLSNENELYSDKKKLYESLGLNGASGDLVKAIVMALIGKI